MLCVVNAMPKSRIVAAVVLLLMVTAGSLLLSSCAQQEEPFAMHPQARRLASVAEESSVPGEVPPRADDPLEGVRERSAEVNREAYAAVTHNPFLRPGTNPLSTFALDVDTASFTNVRRLLESGQAPTPGAVRVEEFVNYFDYDAPAENLADAGPMSVGTTLFDCPWQPQHKLMRVDVKALEHDPETRPAANVVFLVDVSGSMNSSQKLPLVQTTLRILLESLRPDDRVGIVVYAGSAGVWLDSTEAKDRDTIQLKIDQLTADGSTHGAAGINAAYAMAEKHFIKGGINRVVLCTDGDFNVGPSSESELVELIENKAESGVYLTVLGFGSGNYQDQRMEMLSNKGNGNAAYIDSPAEARRAMGRKALANLMTVARDAKIQVEFNPAEVAAYRLIGYENRALHNEDFNDDTVDAGEVGAGHHVTALYEIVPAGASIDLPEADRLRYAGDQPKDNDFPGELATVKLRFQPPGDLEAESQLVQVRVKTGSQSITEATDDARFAAAVAGFAMLLRESPHAGECSFDAILRLAEESVGEDPHGERRMFVDLVKQAKKVYSAESRG